MRCKERKYDCIVNSPPSPTTDTTPRKATMKVLSQVCVTEEREFPIDTESFPPPENAPRLVCSYSPPTLLQSLTFLLCSFVTEGRLIVPHLGRIIYVDADRTSDGYSLVLYQPTSGNTHHIYKVTCDDEYNVYDKAEYLCTEVRFFLPYFNHVPS